MTTPLQHLLAAQDAVEAEGGKRDDWQRVAIRIACALAIAKNSMSEGHLRLKFLAGITADDLKLDDGNPLDVTETPVNLEKPTVS